MASRTWKRCCFRRSLPLMRASWGGWQRPYSTGTCCSSTLAMKAVAMATPEAAAAAKTVLQLVRLSGLARGRANLLRSSDSRSADDHQTLFTRLQLAPPPPMGVQVPVVKVSRVSPRCRGMLPRCRGRVAVCRASVAGGSRRRRGLSRRRRGLSRCRRGGSPCRKVSRGVAGCRGRVAACHAAVAVCRAAVAGGSRSVVPPSRSVAPPSRAGRRPSRRRRGLSRRRRGRVAARRAAVAARRGVSRVSRAIFFLSKPRHVLGHPSEGGVPCHFVSRSYPTDSSRLRRTSASRALPAGCLRRHGAKAQRHTRRRTGC